jgi:hypothetical protein
MLVPSERLAEFERSYLRDVLREMSYARALEIFTALWVEAQYLNPDLGADWLDDLEPALAIARTLNALEPAA